MFLLQDAVWQHAMERPSSTALVCRGRRMSYRRLDDLSNQMARLLANAGCRPGDRIALFLPKSIEAIVAMLGVLKADAIYVPIDVRSPAARTRKIVDACEPRCALVLGEGRTLLERLQRGGWECTVGCLDANMGTNWPGAAFHWDDLASVSAAPVPHAVSPDAPAHILFTSGSTGTPKGVVITHANVIAFLNWANPYFGLGPDDRISGHPPLHFDLSTYDIYGAFQAGAALHLAGPETTLLPRSAVEFMQSARLTQWFSVPSVLKFIAQFDALHEGALPDLKRVLWCGEALPTPTLIYWMRRLPHVQFTNLYGPTEATIASSFYTVPQCPARPDHPIPIGQACGGEFLAVLDASLRPLPPGETGDLYIGGSGLSPGYWRDPEKTAAAFVTAPDGSRIYRTGDLARIGEDGLFYLLGRSDSQIKSRGYRIELGEIETALYTLPQIRECAVVAVASHDFDGVAICCVYVPRDSDPGAAALREQLKGLLPSYMIPSRWQCAGSLPLNGNGKVDRPLVRERFQLEAAAV